MNPFGTVAAPGSQAQPPAPPPGQNFPTVAQTPIAASGGASPSATPVGSGKAIRAEEDEKARLVEEIRQADARIAKLLPQARTLREQRQGCCEALQKRTEQVQAKLLAGTIVPVNGPEVHKARKAHKDDREVHPMQRDLESMREFILNENKEELGKIVDTPIGEGRVVGFQLGGFRREDEVANAPDGQPPPAALDWQGAPLPKAETYNCEVVLSNAMVMPSPLYSNGPLSECGLMSNVYPVTRPPWQWDRDMRLNPVWLRDGRLQEAWSRPIHQHGGRNFLSTFQAADASYAGMSPPTDFVFRGPPGPTPRLPPAPKDFPPFVKTFG